MICKGIFISPPDLRASAAKTTVCLAALGLLGDLTIDFSEA
jgi:hypothetical protein